MPKPDKINITDADILRRVLEGIKAEFDRGNDFTVSALKTDTRRFKEQTGFGDTGVSPDTDISAEADTAGRKAGEAAGTIQGEAAKSEAIKTLRRKQTTKQMTPEAAQTFEETVQAAGQKAYDAAYAVAYSKAYAEAFDKVQKSFLRKQTGAAVGDNPLAGPLLGTHGLLGNDIRTIAPGPLQGSAQVMGGQLAYGIFRAFAGEAAARSKPKAPPTREFPELPKTGLGKTLDSTKKALLRATEKTMSVFSQSAASLESTEEVALTAEELTAKILKEQTESAEAVLADTRITRLIQEFMNSDLLKRHSAVNAELFTYTGTREDILPQVFPWLLQLIQAETAADIDKYLSNVTSSDKAGLKTAATELSNKFRNTLNQIAHERMRDVYPRSLFTMTTREILEQGVKAMHHVISKPGAIAVTDVVVSIPAGMPIFAKNEDSENAGWDAFSNTVLNIIKDLSIAKLLIFAPKQPDKEGCYVFTIKYYDPVFRTYTDKQYKIHPEESLRGNAQNFTAALIECLLLTDQSLISLPNTYEELEELKNYLNKYASPAQRDEAEKTSQLSTGQKKAFVTLMRNIDKKMAFLKGGAAGLFQPEFDDGIPSPSSNLDPAVVEKVVEKSSSFVPAHPSAATVKSQPARPPIPKRPQNALVETVSKRNVPDEVPSGAIWEGAPAQSFAVQKSLEDVIKRPEDTRLEKYTRMMKSGLPHGAVWNAMQRDGLKLEDAEKLRLDIPELNQDTTSKVAPTAAQTQPLPPPRSATQPSRSIGNNLLEEIKTGKPLKKVEPTAWTQQPPDARRTAMLASISSGKAALKSTDANAALRLTQKVDAEARRRQQAGAGTDADNFKAPNAIMQFGLLSRRLGEAGFSVTYTGSDGKTLTDKQVATKLLNTDIPHKIQHITVELRDAQKRNDEADPEFESGYEETDELSENLKELTDLKKRLSDIMDIETRYRPPGARSS